MKKATDILGAIVGGTILCTWLVDLILPDLLRMWHSILDHLGLLPLPPC